MPTVISDLYYHFYCLFCHDLRGGRDLLPVKAASRSNNNWNELHSLESPDKTERGSAQPCLTHPTLRTGNVVSVTLWTAQIGNWTAAGKDRQGCGSVARRVTENSPSAFLKQMLSSYSLCTENKGRQQLDGLHLAGTAALPMNTHLLHPCESVGVTEAPGEASVQDREHAKHSEKAGNE